jgi:hypothetical protein
VQLFVMLGDTEEGGTEGCKIRPLDDDMRELPTSSSTASAIVTSTHLDFTTPSYRVKIAFPLTVSWNSCDSSFVRETDRSQDRPQKKCGTKDQGCSRDAPGFCL